MHNTVAEVKGDLAYHTDKAVHQIPGKSRFHPPTHPPRRLLRLFPGSVYLSPTFLNIATFYYWMFLIDLVVESGHSVLRKITPRSQDHTKRSGVLYLDCPVSNPSQVSLWLPRTHVSGARFLNTVSNPDFRGRVFLDHALLITPFV